MNPNKSADPESKIPEIVSYLTIRKAVGIIGISLPIVLLAGSFIISDCSEVQGSISKYYHTVMRNVFVGALCAVALFLWTYKGYRRDAKDHKYMIPDNPAGNLAALFALGVAFFPTYIGSDDLTSCIRQVYDHKVIGTLHLIWAFLFFLSLAYFSIILFTKGKNKSANRFYKICGYTILGSITLIIIYLYILNDIFPQLRKINPVFWLETFALWAFGVSWLTKGKVSFASSKKN